MRNADNSLPDILPVTNLTFQPRPQVFLTLFNRVLSNTGTVLQPIHTQNKKHFMKTVSIQKLAWSLMLVAGPAMLTAVQAQTDKKPGPDDKRTSIRIRVMEDDNGKVRDIEKSYIVGAMNDEQRQQFVDKVLDSLNVDKKKKQTISITVDDGNDGIAAKRKRKVIIDHRDDREPMAFHWDGDFKYEHDWNSDKFRENMKTLEKNFNHDFHPKAKILMRDMEEFGQNFGKNFNYAWDMREDAKPASIRSLNAYTNNPTDDVLNLRFGVPEKGNVTVTVTDTKGREVGKKEIHDFEGEYVGQIELKKNTKGTLFVTVVQNEDGAVKRVVIP